MKTLSHILLLGLSLLLLTVADTAQAQDNDSPVYPYLDYGCVPDSSLRKSWMDWTPVRCSKANFSFASFDSRADFSRASFDSLTYFFSASFDSLADFSRAEINDHIMFLSADLLGSFDFRFARFDSAAVVTFHRTHLGDSLLLGDSIPFTLPHFDFTRANLLSAGEKVIPADTVRNQKAKTITYPGAKIILFGPVDLKMQLEKFKFIAFPDSLGYFEKKDIVTTLKEVSFPGTAQAKERFELDYIFAKSTMYQKQTFRYERYPFYHPSAWRDSIYYHLMGLGYRPFKIFIWAIVFVALFAVCYLLKMPDRINTYLTDEKGVFKVRSKMGKRTFTRFKYRHLTNTVINCVYFSCTMFFTFRLKKDVLTFFNHLEKRIVVFQWVLGFAVYVAFLTLAKSGSILHTLRSLFVGG